MPCIAALCLLAATGFAATKGTGWRWCTAAAIPLTALLLGLTAYDLRNPANHENCYTNHVVDGDKTIVVAEITNMPQRTAKRLKATAKITAIASGDSLTTTSGKAIVFFDTLATWVTPCMRVAAVGQFKPMPYEVGAEHFRYRRYMQRKGVMSDCFANDIVPIGLTHSPTRLLQRLRNRLANIVNSSTLSPEKQGIARALVLGDRDAPQLITREEFRAAGLSHLLCVSGLHVGVVAMLVSLMFRPFGARLRITRDLAELAVVWLFAAITGMAPSTMRAATMFSFLIAGRLFSNRPASLNVLGLSAIALLLYRPTMISDIGFQLSYTAVAGILVFYKPLRDLLPIKKLLQVTPGIAPAPRQLSRAKRFQLRASGACRYLTASLLNLAWESAVLCTVAQISVMPLILYWFHQLTPWFLIANLLIVPYAGVLLGSIMLMLAVSSWPWGWRMMQAVVDWELGVVCNITHNVAKLPYAIIEGVNFTLPMLAVSLLLLTTVALYIHRGKPGHHAG